MASGHGTVSGWLAGVSASAAGLAVLASSHTPAHGDLARDGWFVGCVVVAVAASVALIGTGVHGLASWIRARSNPTGSVRPGRVYALPVRNGDPSPDMDTAGPEEMGDVGSSTNSNPNRTSTVALDRTPLVLTIRDLGTYAQYQIPPPRGRGLVSLHAAIYAANPGGVPITIPSCRLEQIAVDVGLRHPRGSPLRTDPSQEELSYPWQMPGTIGVLESASEHGCPAVVRPGTTSVLSCVFYLPVTRNQCERARGALDLRHVSGQVILVDELREEHSAGRVTFRG